MFVRRSSLTENFAEYVSVYGQNDAIDTYATRLIDSIEDNENILLSPKENAFVKEALVQALENLYDDAANLAGEWADENTDTALEIEEARKGRY